MTENIRDIDNYDHWEKLRGIDQIQLDFQPLPEAPMVLIWLVEPRILICDITQYAPGEPIIDIKTS